MISRPHDLNLSFDSLIALIVQGAFELIVDD
jgi:hypothetical protein